MIGARAARLRLPPAVEPLLGAMAFAAGNADVFAFQQFHEIFTSAMTGNTALLGLALGRWHLLAAARSIAAIGGFVTGSAVGTSLHDAGGNVPRPTRFLRLIAAECVLLLLVVVIWPALTRPVYGGPLFVLILLQACAMGIQSAAGRELNQPGITTVVFTSTLTIIAMSMTRAALGRSRKRVIEPATQRQLGALGAYLVGAAVSAILGLISPALLPVPALLAIAIAVSIALLRPQAIG